MGWKGKRGIKGREGTERGLSLPKVNFLVNSLHTPVATVVIHLVEVVTLTGFCHKESVLGPKLAVVCPLL